MARLSTFSVMLWKKFTDNFVVYGTLPTGPEFECRHRNSCEYLVAINRILIGKLSQII
jgi:hypothetical protein